jgi:hypothetical protein
MPWLSSDGGERHRGAVTPGASGGAGRRRIAPAAPALRSLPLARERALVARRVPEPEEVLANLPPAAAGPS